jgi:hypothetical protein
LPALAIAVPCHAQSVLGYHGSPDRGGNFIVPALTWERAGSLHLDAGFHPQFAGHLYAQPLYWQPPSSGPAMLIVATENDDVLAIDAKSGSQIWTRSLGQPIPLSTEPCGNIDPLGITGTPVIDPAIQAVFLDAMVGDASGAHHRVFALSMKDGSILQGWPVDAAPALATRGQRFNTRFQNHAVRSPSSRAGSMCPMAAISAIAEITSAGSSASACRIRGTLSAGALAGGAAGFGRRAGSAATGARSLSRPATPWASPPGATARRCSD